ncbi:MAG: hypothetical protein QOE70_4958 [Chthoniobacter sp.]|jgi:hypothetical protein|nr:hypothetical protein [Chthoniobacter sp.]
MIFAEADEAKRLLTMQFTNRVSVEEMLDLVPKMPVLLSAIAPGFTLLTDLSQLEWMDPACAPEIGNLMDLVSAKGVKTVVRVIPDPAKDIGFALMSSFHYGREVRVVVHETLEDGLQSVPPIHLLEEEGVAQEIANDLTPGAPG